MKSSLRWLWDLAQALYHGGSRGLLLFIGADLLLVGIDHVHSILQSMFSGFPYQWNEIFIPVMFIPFWLVGIAMYAAELRRKVEANRIATDAV